MYYIGQKLRMLDNYGKKGEGKNKIVYVAKLQEDGTPEIVETDGSWGWDRKINESTLVGYISRSSNHYWSVYDYTGGFEIMDFKIGDKMELKVGLELLEQIKTKEAELKELKDKLEKINNCQHE